MHSSIIYLLLRKKTFIFGVVILLCLAAPLQSDAEQKCLKCNIEVLFYGDFTDETCKISVNGGGYSGTVNLSPVTTRYLSNDGDEAGSEPFDIVLLECPAERTVSVIFKSNEYAVDMITGNITNAVEDGYSKNVQIRIRKEDGSQVKVDDDSSGQDYQIPASGADVRHTFAASYYAKGKAAVTPGYVKTAASIDLIYK